jgi:hypothetical protein
MVLSSLIKNILPIAAAGLGIAFLINIIKNPAQAQQSADVIGSLGSGIGESLGSIGAGANTFLTGIGTGSAQLLNPLWTLKDLFYSNDDDSVLIREQALDQSNTTVNNPVPNSPSAGAGTSHTPAQGTSTIHFSSGAVSVPALSTAAKRYYANVGTDVT